MINENIESLIDSLNKGEMRDRVFTSPLSPSVDYAKAWLHELKSSNSHKTSDEFYFIKNDDGLYVGVIFDMWNDLHVFVKPAHRGKGYLATSLNNIILPRLYQLGRKKQNITFKEKEVGEYFVRRMGFEMVGQGRASKDLSCFSGVKEIPLQNKVMSDKEFDDMMKKINLAQAYIRMAKEQYQSYFGESDVCDIEYIEDDIKSLDNSLYQYISDLQGELGSVQNSVSFL